MQHPTARTQGRPQRPPAHLHGVHHSLLALAITTLTACNAPPRLGHPAPQEAPPTASGETVRWNVRPYARHVSAGHSAVGDVGSSRAGTEFGVEFSPGGNWSVALNGKVERAHYALPDLVTQAAPAGRTAGLDLDQFEVGVQAAYQASERWTHMLYGTLTSGLESGADFSDSLRTVLHAGTRYAPSEELGLMAGIVSFSQLEGDTIVAPLIAFDWRPAESWTLNFGLPETSLTYAVNESLQIGLRMDFEFFDYRLDGQGPLPGGALTNELVTLGLHTSWSWSDTGSAWLTIGQPLYHKLKVHDDTGGLQLETDVKSDVFVGLGMEWNF